MVLSAIKSSPCGRLSNLIAFFTATFPSIHPEMQLMGFSEMSISKKAPNGCKTVVAPAKHGVVPIR